MKKILIVMVAIVVFACKNTDTASNQIETEIPENIEEVETTEEDQPLLGGIEKHELQQGSYKNWYETQHQELTADDETIRKIDEYIHDYEIVVFMGTWCSDSQREIPQLLNILEQVNFDEEKISIYGVDENKEEPNNKHVEYDVAYVPTIIFLKDGKEVNRFVEFAQESLAQDVLKIVSGAEYVNPYAE